MKVLDYFSGKSWWSILVHFALIVLVSIVGLVYFFNSYLTNYTKHGQVIEVPNLNNLSLEEVQLKLDELKLRYEVSDTVYSERHEVNAVVSQVPSPKAEVKEGRRIYLTLNMPEKPKIKITEAVLNKIQKSYISQVKINIANLGLEIGQIDVVDSPYKDYVEAVYKGGKQLEVGDELFLGDKIRLEIGRGVEVEEDTLVDE